MSRYFAPIFLDDFKAKFLQAFFNEKEKYIDFEKIVDTLKKDIKVEFDLENYEWEKGQCSALPNIMGFGQFHNGMSFCGCYGGGDWEHPVYFIVYWDGKKLRAYVPTDGNPWNTTTKQAYGNGDDGEDLANAKKRWPATFKDAEEFEVDDVEFDEPAIIKDIHERIALATPDQSVKPEKSTKLTYKQALEKATELCRKFLDDNGGMSNGYLTHIRAVSDDTIIEWNTPTADETLTNKQKRELSKDLGKQLKELGDSISTPSLLVRIIVESQLQERGVSRPEAYITVALDD